MSTAQPSPVGRHRLRRRLVIGVMAVVTVVAVMLSGLTIAATHHTLKQQLDHQLAAAAHRFREPGNTSTGGSGTGQRRQRNDPGPGQTQNLLVYVSASDDGYVQQDRSQVALSDAARAQLRALPARQTPHELNVSGLGHYRVLVSANQTAGTLVTGLPTTELTQATRTIGAFASLFTILAIALAGIATHVVVKRSLQPLDRLAATAHQVSHLPLESGEVAVPMRIAACDTDPAHEVGQVGLAFNHMLDHVEHSLAARQRSETQVRRFVADASHELRNPLASIRGYAELTRRNRVGLPDDTRYALERIDAEAERMSRLVEDLLLLARLDVEPGVVRAEVDLVEVVSHAVSDAQVAGPDHDWTLSLPDHDVLVLGDAHQLIQVVVNLLTNARTHTPAGTTVHTTVRIDQPWAVVTVADTGPGIPPDLIGRVFERFSRADPSRARLGEMTPGRSTGLGMAIVAAVIKAHQGQVSVDSTLGQGTTFIVQLPLAEAHINPCRRL